MARKLPKNNWKKVNIDVDYNTAKEVSRKRREQDRKKYDERHEAQSRKYDGNKELKGHNNNPEQTPDGIEHKQQQRTIREQKINSNYGNTKSKIKNDTKITKDSSGDEQAVQPELAQNTPYW